MVTSDDTKDVYIVGGYDDSNNQRTNKVYKLRCEESTPENCLFEEIPTKLKVARQNHIALPISEDFANQLCL